MKNMSRNTLQLFKIEPNYLDTLYFATIFLNVKNSKGIPFVAALTLHEPIKNLPVRKTKEMNNPIKIYF